MFSRLPARLSRRQVVIPHLSASPWPPLPPCPLSAISSPLIHPFPFYQMYFRCVHLTSPSTTLILAAIIPLQGSTLPVCFQPILPKAARVMLYKQKWDRVASLCHARSQSPFSEPRVLHGVARQPAQPVSFSPICFLNPPSSFSP